MLKKPFIFSKLLTPAALVALGLVPVAGAADDPATLHSVKLAWNPSTNTDVRGYRVHVESQPGNYNTDVSAGLDASATIPNLEYGKTYYFAVRAINSEGTEGYLSQELAVAIAPPPLPVASEISPAATGQLALKWSFPASALGSSPDFIIQSSPDLVTWTNAGTVPASAISGGNSQTASYQWPITPVAGKSLFYRLTARNWMGDAIPNP